MVSSSWMPMPTGQASSRNVGTPRTPAACAATVRRSTSSIARGPGGATAIPARCAMASSAPGCRACARPRRPSSTPRHASAPRRRARAAFARSAAARSIATAIASRESIQCDGVATGTSSSRDRRSRFCVRSGPNGSPRRQVVIPTRSIGDQSRPMPRVSSSGAEAFEHAMREVADRRREVVEDRHADRARFAHAEHRR